MVLRRPIAATKPVVKFWVTVTTLSGDSKCIEGLHPDSILLSLYERVADEFKLPLGEFHLCAGTQLFEVSELRSTLCKLEVGSGCVLAVARAAPRAEAAEYLVMQETLLKKPGADQASTRVVRLKRKVGSKLRGTGRSWTGPGGGEWVELDPFSERPGWMLVEGSGFCQPGPLLERLAPGDGERLVLSVLSPVDDTHLCEICLRPQQTVRHAKHWIALRCPGLRPDKISVIKQRPRRGTKCVPASWIISDGVQMRDTPFKDGDELPYFYVGDVSDDLACAPEDWPAVEVEGKCERELLWW